MSTRILSTIVALLAFSSSLFSNVYTVTVTNGNDWWPACGTAGSFKQALCDAAANPGRDTIEFDFPGGTSITAAQNPITLDATASDLYINGNGTNGTPVTLTFSLDVTAGTNIEIDSLNFQTTNHSLTFTGANNIVRNSSFATTGAWQNCVWIDGGTGSEVRNCTFTASQVHAVSVENGGGHTIDGNTITGITDNSIMIRGTGGNTISNNDVSGSGINAIGVIADNNIIDNNDLYNNTGAGVIISNGDGNTVSNCEIYGNQKEGIGVQDGTSANNTINDNLVYNNNQDFDLLFGNPVIEQAAIKSMGTNTTIEDNFIYGNNANGVLVYDGGIVGGGANTGQGANSTIQRNTIGRDNLGTENGNGWNGIMVWGANNTTSDNNTIVNNGSGASHATYSMPDRISGIRYQQISSGAISNNFIGTDAAKTVAPNEFDGITLHTTVSNVTVTSNVIGYNGTSPSYPAYGAGGGIALRNNANDNTIQSNFIGMHQDLTDAGNFDYGIDIELGASNLVGGDLPAQGNNIGYSKNTSTAAGNHGCGVWLVLTGNTDNELFNNNISFNEQDGVLIERGARGNTVGKLTAPNAITNNNVGIRVQDNGTGNTNQNTLRGNAFACNTVEGILLTDNGNDLYGGIGASKVVTTNPNEARANFVSGTAPANAVVDVYSSDVLCVQACTDSVNQGAEYVATVNADASGFWEYDLTDAANAAATNPVTQANVIVMATETGANPGLTNSSEFSICAAVCNAPTNVVLNANDVDLCAGETTTLTANANGMSGNSYSYSFFEGADILTGTLVAYQVDDSTLVVSAAGTYFVKIAELSDTATCVDSSAGLTINVDPVPQLNLTANQTEFCDGDSATLSSGASGAGNETILWSPGGESTADITVYGTGSYSVTIEATVSGRTCDTSATVNITENPNPTPTLSDAFICQGDETTLDPGVPGMNYAWAPGGQNTETLTVSIEDTYTVTVTNPATNCSGQASAFVDESPVAKPDVIIEPLEDSICFPKSEELLVEAELVGAGEGTWTWSNNVSTTSSAVYADTGQVIVAYVDTFGCSGGDTMLIVNFCQPPVVEVPNIFIPGGTDNPVFTPIGTITPDDVIEGHMEVYNRWGRLMFETTERVPEWDGTFNGRPAASGVYFWIWTYTDVNNNDYKLNGFVELWQSK